MMRRATLAPFALLMCAACTLEPPFERSNPFDPGSPYEMRLVGVPDTVDVRGMRFTASIERDPPLPPGTLSIAWQAIDPTIIPPPFTPPVASGVVLPLAGGEYLVAPSLSAQFVPVGIQARFTDEVIVSKQIVAGQRARALTLACGTLAVPAACDAAPLTIGAGATVRSTMLDGGGSPLSGLQFAMARASVLSRNPAVIAPSVTPNAAGTFNVLAAGAGSTWLVIRVDFATDSVRFVVNP